MVKNIVNAQNWLDQEFFKDGICQIETTDKGPDGKGGWNNKGKKREQITKLDISNKGLEEELIIENFPNLEKIQCRSNEGLTSIKLTNLPKLDYFHGNGCHLEKIIVKDCPNITFFNVANNYLTDTSFLNGLNPEKLAILSLHSNNFSQRDLEFLSKFINLEQVFLDNCDEEKFENGIYNKFFGSLKPLQNLTKLELLSIGKTDIDSGLEYLSDFFRKVGLTTSFQADTTGCAKLRQELEVAAQVEGVKEKLKNEEEEVEKNGEVVKDPAWYDDYYRIAPWREAQKILGEKFKDITQPNAQKWLDEKYPKNSTEEIKKRKNIIFLNINSRNLEGELDLSDFVNLEKLDCSFNQLTNLNLSECKNLTHLNCSSNKFTSVEFLNQVPNKEKIQILKINKNEKLKGGLEFLSSFTGLKELNLESCAFFGSLEPLKNMNNLKRVFISYTDISEGSEFLPSNCKEFYCDTSDYKYKSIKIVKELGKFLEGRCYNILKWKKDKENNISSRVIPLERLYVIRGNIKKFVNKWGKDAESGWYEWFFAKLIESNKVNELSKLQSPKEFGIYRYTKSAKWIARAGAVGGGVLALTDNSVLGGALATVSPFVEILASNAEDELYATKQQKWDEFISDAENLLDNYHELLGILEQIKKSELGKVNQGLNNLRAKARKFLEEYDKDENGTVDVSELIEKSKFFGKDLAKESPEGGGSQLGDIVLAIKELEKEVTNYRQGISEKEREVVNKEEVNLSQKEEHESIDLDKHFEEKIEVPSK